jgi:hypothetical protein
VALRTLYHGNFTRRLALALPSSLVPVTSLSRTSDGQHKDGIRFRNVTI